MKPRAPNRRAAAGFSLIEILVVMAIVSLTVAISLPYFKLNRSDQPPLMQYLQKQKYLAAQQGRRNIVSLKKGALSSTLDNTPLKLEGTLIINRPPNADYLPSKVLTTFYPDGTALHTDAFLKKTDDNGPHTWVVYVNPFNGRVTYETKNEPSGGLDAY